jgi:cysteine-rich repeat protein
MKESWSHSWPWARQLSALGLGLGLAAAVALAACSSSTNTQTKTDRLCTPGAYVFCLCQTGVDGTKLCHDDGQAFDECLLPGDSPCPGGEIPSDGGLVDSSTPPGSDAAAPVDAGPGNPVDTCPGKPTAVDPNKPTVVMGSTATGKDNAAGKPGACAVGISSPDNIYRIIPTAKGSLTVSVKGEGTYDPTVYLRTTCTDPAAQVACAESTGAGGTETFNINVVTGAEYALFVDGKTGSAGAYTLTLSLKPGSFCGDGTVDTGEACDDGNHTDNDGCSPDCRSINGDTSPVLLGALCPGEPVHLWGGATVVNATGSTTLYPNSWKDTDSTCKKTTNVNNAPDHIYAVTAHKAGTLTVTTVNATFNVELLARTVCADAITTGAGMCANVNTTTSPPFDESMSFAVSNGTTYYVAVDGASAASKGDYQLTFSLP